MNIFNIISIFCIFFTIFFYGNASPVTVDYIIDKMNESDLRNVSNFLKGTLQDMRVNENVRIIGPRARTITRIASFSIREDISWPQRRHIWRESLRAVDKFFKELLAGNSGPANMKEVLAYLARNRITEDYYEIVLFSAQFAGERGEENLKDNLEQMRFHLIKLDADKFPQITKDNFAYWADNIQRRGGKLLTMENSISELRERIGNMNLPVLKIAPHGKLKGFSSPDKMLIELVWEGYGVDLDLIVLTQDEELSFRHPEQSFGQWGRSSDASIAKNYWEKSSLNEEVLRNPSDITVEVAHVNGPPPGVVKLDIYLIEKEQNILKQRYDLSGAFNRPTNYGDPQRRWWKLADLMSNRGYTPNKMVKNTR